MIGSGRVYPAVALVFAHAAALPVAHFVVCEVLPITVYTTKHTAPQWLRMLLFVLLVATVVTCDILEPHITPAGLPQRLSRLYGAGVRAISLAAVVAAALLTRGGVVVWVWSARQVVVMCAAVAQLVWAGAYTLARPPATNPRIVLAMLLAWVAAAVVVAQQPFNPAPWMWAVVVGGAAVLWLALPLPPSAYDTRAEAVGASLLTTAATADAMGLLLPPPCFALGGFRGRVAAAASGPELAAAALEVEAALRCGAVGAEWRRHRVEVDLALQAVLRQDALPSEGLWGHCFRSAPSLLDVAIAAAAKENSFASLSAATRAAQAVLRQQTQVDRQGVAALRAPEEWFQQQDNDTPLLLAVEARVAEMQRAVLARCAAAQPQPQPQIAREFSAHSDASSVPVPPLLVGAPLPPDAAAPLAEAADPEPAELPSGGGRGLSPSAGSSSFALSDRASDGFGA